MSKLNQHEIMALLVQLSVMLLMGRFFAELARKVKQPAVVGEIIAGLILGPTVLGMVMPEWFDSLFPSGSSWLVYRDGQGAESHLFACPALFQDREKSRRILSHD